MSELARQDTDGELANQVEGYLLWQARIAEAERRAQEFVRPMDWLTTSQRAQVEQRHVSDSLQRAQQDLERIAARCASLRAEYESRYRLLRRRCLGLTLAVCAALATLAALLSIL
ncbi:cytochrome C oxidase subunit I [Streptomyces sp. NPDC006012]|uniref:cytochrome C oxidase subunit I n=1 Tax=Streptomyces sp. NPDC006012 TaxID=3364739 RepID=UPI0036C04C6C